MLTIESFKGKEKKIGNFIVVHVRVKGMLGKFDSILYEQIHDKSRIHIIIEKLSVKVNYLYITVSNIKQ